MASWNAIPTLLAGLNTWAGRAMLSEEKADYHPITFSAELSEGIQLSQLSNP